VLVGGKPGFTEDSEAGVLGERTFEVKISMEALGDGGDGVAKACWSDDPLVTERLGGKEISDSGTCAGTLTLSPVRASWNCSSIEIFEKAQLFESTAKVKVGSDVEGSPTKETGTNALGEPCRPPPRPDGRLRGLVRETRAGDLGSNVLANEVRKRGLEMDGKDMASDDKTADE